jgi:hypothetical protein
VSVKKCAIYHQWTEYSCSLRARFVGCSWHQFCDEHYIICYITCSVPVVCTGPKKQHFNFLKADFVAINKKLSDIDWSFLKPISDIDVMMEAFYSKLNDIFSICVPRSLRFYKSKYPPWFNSSIVKQLRQKHKLWLIYKQSKSPLFYDEFKSIRKIIKLEIKRAHCKYILQVEQNITKDPKT